MSAPPWLGHGSKSAENGSCFCVLDHKVFIFLLLFGGAPTCFPRNENIPFQCHCLLLSVSGPPLYQASVSEGGLFHLLSSVPSPFTALKRENANHLTSFPKTRTSDTQPRCYFQAILRKSRREKRGKKLLYLTLAINSFPFR